VVAGAPFAAFELDSLEHLPYTARRRWHIDVAQFNTTVESVDDGVDDRRRRADMHTAILSNGSPMMLDAAVNAAGLGSLLDAVLSVEEVGVYKPHAKVYQLAVDRIGVPASAIAYESSNAWDAYAASAFGMQVAGCNRYGQWPERSPGKPDGWSPRSQNCRAWSE
jgi:2-haloalkanoic acid dehalogenase type II